MTAVSFNPGFNFQSLPFNNCDASLHDPITQEPIENPVALSPCGHCFSDSDFLNKILSENSFCPICRSPVHEKLKLYLSDLFKQNGKYRSSFKTLEAQIHIKDEKRNLALNALNEAIELCRENANAYYHRSEIFFHLGKLNEATNDLLFIKKLNPTLLDSILEHANETLKTDPQNILCLIYRGDIHCLKDNDDLAFADQNAALEIEPNNSFALTRRGYLYWKQDDDERALQDVNAALIANPKNTYALFLRGDLHRLQKNDDLALEDLNAALKLNPNDIQSLLARGDIYRTQDKFELAMQDFNTAIEFDSKNPFALARRGEIYHLQDKFELALSDLNAALNIRPNYVFALETRADVYRCKKKIRSCFARCK